jgi:hypothetical protein
MKALITSVVEYIREDWAENKIRTILEITAWVNSIGCSIIMAFTLPNPPFLILYPMFIAHCAVFAYCAYTRGSTGMLANYIMLTVIDVFALARLLYNS